MFVLNDVTKDARVLKEAASLAAAGYDVTIMGLLPVDSPLPERETRPEGFTIIRTPYPVGREWWRPHPHYFGIAYRRLRSSAARWRYRLARRHRLLLGAFRRLKGRAHRRHRLALAAARRLRYRAWRRRALTVAAIRRIRYHAVRQRKLKVAAARRWRYLAWRRRRLLLAEAGRPRHGGSPSRIGLVLAFLGIASTLSLPRPTAPRRPSAARTRRRGDRHRVLVGRARRVADRSFAYGIGTRRLGGWRVRGAGRTALRSTARVPGRGQRDRSAVSRTGLRSRGARNVIRLGRALSLGWLIARRLARRVVRRRRPAPATRPQVIAVPRAAGARRGPGRIALGVLRAVAAPAGRVTWVAWSCLYATLHIVTAGHLDWVLRLRYRWDGWGRAAAARAPLADVWHAHDLSGLFGAMRGHDSNGSPVVYDSHEIMLESSGFAVRPRWARWFLARVERRWAARATALVTVNDMLARELGQRLAPRRTVVVYNCPSAQEPAHDVPVDHLRIAAGIAPGTPVALYHGGLMRHRGCEQLAEALLEPGLEHVHGVLLGYGGQREAFVEMARDPRFGGRLHVLDAVPPHELVGWVSTADVAVMPIQASTLNHRMSTPNKLFEAIGAGVPVIGSDFEGFRDVVYGNPSGPLGLLCDPEDVAAIARGIRQILGLSPEERLAMKRRCIAAARERWNWEREVRGLVRLYNELTGREALPGLALEGRAAA